MLKCAVLLVRGPHASYAPSIYVDDHGEEDVGLRRGAPLRLHAGRVAALEALYNTHGVAREVARLRARVVARDPGQLLLRLVTFD